MQRLRRHWRLAVALLLLVLTMTGPPGLRAAQNFNTQVLTSATATYAVLRTINAALSTAKQTSVGVEFVGAVEAKPGMVLDPLDETVARVSDAVFALAGISALLAVAFAPVGSVGLGLAAIGLGGLWLMREALPGTPARGAERGLRAMTGFGLVLGLILPLGYALGGWLGNWATADRLTAALARLRGGEDDPLAALTDPPGPQAATDSGLFERVLNGVSGSLGDMAAQIPELEQIETRATEIFQASLEILAIFTLQLVVFPVLTLALLVVVIRHVMRP